MVDLDIFYHIKDQLGFGKVLIRDEPERRVGVFYVSGKENFTRLIHIFNGNLITLHRKTQFLNWLTAYNKLYHESMLHKEFKIKLSLDTS